MGLLELMRGAYFACKENVGLREGEKVVIVTDEDKREFGRAFEYVSRALGAKVTYIEIEKTGRHGAEPPEPVARALSACDVFFLPTTYSLSHTDARRDACKGGARGVSMPGITEEMFKAIQVPLERLKELTHKVADLLDEGDEVRIRSENGTDLFMKISGRECLRDDGDYTKPGSWGNLPAGEACLAPIEESVEGVLVVDRWGNKIKVPSRVVIKGGKAVEFEGQAIELKRVLESSGEESAFFVGELGIGTNPRAWVIGNVLMDEKVLGTCHIAFGDSTSYPGGKNKAKVHEDCVVFSPTIWVDEIKMMEKGTMLI